MSEQKQEPQEADTWDEETTYYPPSWPAAVAFMCKMLMLVAVAAIIAQCESGRIW